MLALLTVLLLSWWMPAHLQAQPGTATSNASFLAAPARPLQALPADAYVTLDLVRVPLPKALRAVSAQTKLRFSYAEGHVLEQLQVTVQAKHVRVSTVLTDLLTPLGFSYEPTDTGIIVIRRLPAAPGRITGEVVEAATGAPLPGANIVIAGTQQGAATDAEGRFVIPSVAPGSYTLEVTMIGFEPKRLPGQVVPESGELVVTVRLEEEALPLGEVVVTPGRFAVMEIEAGAAQTLDREDIQNLPQLGEDIYRAVRRLPGLSGNDFVAGFNVRGGEKREVLVQVDGMTLYDPFHLKDIGGGAFSILDVETIGGIDMMTGAFPAEYGDRMSGVFNITTATPRAGVRRSAVGISFTNTRLSSEGRFAKDRGEWLVMARRGYLDLVFALIDSEDNPSPTYYDVFAKTKYRLNNHHSLSMHVLVADDDLAWDADEDEVVTGYGNAYAWLTWDAIFGRRTHARTLVSAGRVTTNRDALDLDNFRVLDERAFRFAGLKQDWTFDVSANHLLKAGLEVRQFAGMYHYFLRNLIADERVGEDLMLGFDTTQIDLRPHGTQASAYAGHRFRPVRPLTIEWGLRFDHTSWTGDDTWSPRLNAAYRLTPRTAVRLGWGWFHQTQGLHEMYVQDGEDVYYPAERSEHRVAAIEHRFPFGIHARVEAYQKKLTDPRPRYLNLADASTDFVPEVRRDRTRVVADGGAARGVEVYVRRDLGKRFTGWASYGYARTDLEIDGTSYPRSFDQRHTVYLDAGYRPTPNWRISAAWQYHSGWPYTKLLFSAVASDDGMELVSRYGPFNETRLPAYHRMDVRVHRYFTFSRSRLALFAEVTNVYNRTNIRSYDYNVFFGNGYLQVRRSTNDWLPRLPSLGISWEVFH